MNNFKELEEACRALRLQAAILGPAMGSRMKKAVALLLQQKCPGMPIIEVFDGEPVVQGAIHFSGEPGMELVKVVKAAIRKS